MDISSELEAVNFYFELIITTWKFKSEAVVKSVEDYLVALLGSEYTTDILTAAVFQLAETDPDTCRWALRTDSTLNFRQEITEGVVRFAVKKLIDKGFILCQDFSLTSTGGIVITKNAQVALLEGSCTSDRIFLEEISQVCE